MRLIYVKLEKNRNSLFVKIPDLIAESLNLKEGEDIEISIHSEPAFSQGELWESKKQAKDIKIIKFQVSKDTYTINMFNPVTIHSEADFDPESGLYGLEIIITNRIGNYKYKSD